MRIFKRIDNSFPEAEVTILAPTQTIADDIESKLDEKISVVTTDGIYFLSRQEILYVKADKNYIELQTTQKNYKVRSPLYAYEKWLGRDFVRVSRSYLINFSQLSGLGMDLLLGMVAYVGNKKISVSRAYLLRLKDKISEMEAQK